MFQPREFPQHMIRQKLKFGKVASISCSSLNAQMLAYATDLYGYYSQSMVSRRTAVHRWRIYAYALASCPTSALASGIEANIETLGNPNFATCSGFFFESWILTMQYLGPLTQPKTSC